LDHPLLAFIPGYLKIAEARVQQKPRDLQPEALSDIRIIAVHRKPKPGQLGNNAVAVLKGNAPGWLPLIDVPT